MPRYYDNDSTLLLSLAKELAKKQYPKSLEDAINKAQRESHFLRPAPVARTRVFGDWYGDKEHPSYSEKAGIPEELTDITEGIRDGRYHMYLKNYLDDINVYRDTDGKIYTFPKDKADAINTDNLEYISPDDFKALLPKRDYIGGKDYRIRVAQMIPGFMDLVKEKATSYGVDPNLLLHRILKEGWIDNRVKEYNGDPDKSFGINTVDQANFFTTDDILKKPVNGIDDLGLDDAGDNLEKGIYELKDTNALWSDLYGENEKKRPIHSVQAADMNSAIEIMAADMGYRMDQVKNRLGVTGPSLYRKTNAAYNLGLNHKDLSNDSYIDKNYSYPDYYGEILKQQQSSVPLKVNMKDAGGLIERYGVDRIREVINGKKNTFEDGGPKKRTFRDWFTQATLHAAMAENPSVMTASGWKYDDDGNLHQSPDEDSDRLANNIAVISAIPNVVNGIGIARNVSPLAKTLANAMLTADGVRNVVSDNGISKTIDFAKDDKMGRALLSGAGDAIDILGGIGLIGDAFRWSKKMANLSHKWDHLTNMGNSEGLVRKMRPVSDTPIDLKNKHIAEEYFNNNPPKPVYDFTKPFDKANEVEEYFMANVFPKNPTTGNYIDFPEYQIFLNENPGISGFSNDAIEQFAKRQSTAIRGVYGKPEDIETFLITPRKLGSSHKGGDRLGTRGGVYTSNSTDIAKRFSNTADRDPSIISGVGTIEFPIWYDPSGTTYSKLKSIRDGIFGYDDISNAIHKVTGRGIKTKDISDAARKAGVYIGESLYTTRIGSHLPVNERVWLGDLPLKRMSYYTKSNNPHGHGRWGVGGVDMVSSDSDLFLPYQWSIVDKNKLRSILSKMQVSDIDAIRNAEKVYQNRLVDMGDKISHSMPYRYGEFMGKRGIYQYGKPISNSLLSAQIAGGLGGGVIAPLLYSIGNNESRANMEKELYDNGISIPSLYYGDSYQDMNIDEKFDALKDRDYVKFRNNYIDIFRKGLREGKDVKFDNNGSMFDKGGPIHIKPSHRGRFTSLLKRTGKPASWFKAHGTPAQRKMATFALNARKWKHGDGGIIDRLVSTYGSTEKAMEAIRKIHNPS